MAQRQTLHSCGLSSRTIGSVGVTLLKNAPCDLGRGDVLSQDFCPTHGFLARPILNGP